jgi:hypothetical protein
MLCEEFNVKYNCPSLFQNIPRKTRHMVQFSNTFF